MPECKPEWNREAILVFSRLPSLRRLQATSPLQTSLLCYPSYFLKFIESGNNLDFSAIVCATYNKTGRARRQQNSHNILIIAFIILAEKNHKTNNISLVFSLALGLCIFACTCYTTLGSNSSQSRIYKTSFDLLMRWFFEPCIVYLLISTKYFLPKNSSQNILPKKSSQTISPQKMSPKKILKISNSLHRIWRPKTLSSLFNLFLEVSQI